MEETDLAVDQARERLVADAGRAVRHTLDVDVRRQLQREEERVQLGERAAERVADLREKCAARQSCQFELKRAGIRGVPL